MLPFGRDATIYPLLNGAGSLLINSLVHSLSIPLTISKDGLTRILGASRLFLK